MASDRKKPAQNSGLKYMLLLCIGALVLNFAGVLITRLTGAPLFLDTIGTVTAAVLGGYLPGIIVGFLTNIIKGIIDRGQLYYGILNMLTAIITSFLAKRGAFMGSRARQLTLIPVLSLITGSLGGVLTWFLNSSSIGGVAKSVALYFNETVGMGGFASQMCGDLLIEFIDKTITVLLLMLILHIMPDKLKERFGFVDGSHGGLDSEIDKAVRESKCRSVSLRTKILLVFVAGSLLIAGTSTVISFVLYKNSTINDHIKLANGLSELAVSNIDPDRVDEYIEKGEAVPGYLETEEKLYRLRDSSPDVQYVYVYKIMEDGCHVVFDLDTEDMEGSAPGEVIEFDESFEDYIPTLLAGKEIDPIISDDSYGWLLTVYKPVYDKDGNCRCYAAVDISMNLLASFGYSFMAKLISLLVSFFILTVSIGLWIVENDIIRPVNKMAYCAGAFAYNSDEAREEGVERLKELDINTGDEIENLYRAFVKTTEDSMQYVTDIQHKTETISKMQNGLIMVLADMVESRDKCTGDHVKKTAAYVEIITSEMKKRGFYKDRLTDEFINDVRNAAPLHDIGKIHVSDIILNKPGKLTDEEFEIMKSHTYLGSRIIDRAIDMVPDSGYLEEAKNLSEYHHEKWNGKGYPHGISGEDIPLSARIMAVADVFDALVSRRSYKQPFPFEKAMDIIREDAGTHFDPLVAEAFLGAEDRVRKVAEGFEKAQNASGEGVSGE